MSKVAAFTFTNTTAGTNTVTPLALNLPQNYALVQDSSDVVVMSNKTAALDAEELVSFRSRKWNWKPSPKAEIVNPAPVQAGMEYSMQLEDVLTITDTADANYRVDEPIVCTVSFRHNKNGMITNTVMGQVFLRAISALMKADGTWRFEDLMRSAERPVDA